MLVQVPACRNVCGVLYGNRQTKRQMHRWTDRETERQTGREGGWGAERALRPSCARIDGDQVVDRHAGEGPEGRRGQQGGEGEEK
jgi:hypothetical protein